MGSRTGLGRNDRCWCGSGKKYKKCHLGRESEGRPRISEIFNRIKRLPVSTCLHPDAPGGCATKPIKAHSVQRAALERIAEAGHVLTFPHEPNRALPMLMKHDGKLVATRTGIKLASTFTGFCSTHDGKVFEPVERNGFCAGPEHAFLLAYRVICREYHAKSSLVQGRESIAELDRGLSLLEQALYQRRFIETVFSEDTGGLRDSRRLKDEYNRVLKSGNWGRVAYRVFWFDRCPDVLAAGGFYPAQDFLGNALQDLADLRADLEGLTFTSLACGERGAGVFAWIDENGASRAFVESLERLPDDRIPDALVRFVFEHFENKYWRPSWWESLQPEIRDQLTYRSQLAADLHAPRSRDCLTEDGLRVAGWRVTGRGGSPEAT